jgi:phage baseplate assembly protein W
MAKEFLGTGWSFPVAVDRNSQIATSEHEQDIQAAIRIILSIAKGERVMRPDFGCGIHDFVFAVINTANCALIENSVREALTVWEPRIELHTVNVATEQIQAGKLLINIAYTVRTTNNKFNLVYPFYLTEGE